MKDIGDMSTREVLEELDALRDCFMPADYERLEGRSCSCARLHCSGRAIR